jgi:glycosyltransferase involved in cell wall biosynthesis
MESVLESPLVSVVIPIYNGETFLARAIASVSAQTYTPLEIVVIDDGSTDNSLAVVSACPTQAPLRILRQENRGVAMARHAGVLASAGDFIAFLDQDDWWREDKIAKQVEVFQADASLALVHTQAAYFDQSAREFVPPINASGTPHEMVGHCYERLLMANPIGNSTVMIRRSAFDAVGGFDVSIGGNTVADYALWLRLARKFTFAFVPEELAVFRLHANQGTWRRDAMLRAELALLTNEVPETKRRSPQMRQRFAGLEEALGIACLDAGDYDAARSSFMRAWREAPSLRRTGLCLASSLPSGIVERWRRRRRRGVAATGHAAPVSLRHDSMKR